MPNRYRTPLLAIATLQVVAGLYGLFLAVVRLPGSGLPGIAVLFAFLFVCYLALSVFAGYELWQMKRRGGTLSVVVQAIQVPTIIFSPLVWDIYLGPKFAAGLQFRCRPGQIGLHFQFDLDTYFGLVLRSGVECWFFGVNLVAVAAVWILYRALESPAPLESVPEDEAPEVAV